jgi:branched-chain amino acid transport system substrate-binding protein
MKKFAIVYENTDWGISCVETYVKGLVDAGYECVIQESFESGAADFSTIVNKIKSADVDFIMPAMYVSDSQIFWQQLKEYNVTKPIYAAGGGIIVDDFLNAVGELAEGDITLNGWSYDAMYDSYNTDLAFEIDDRCVKEVGVHVNENVANGWIAIATLIDAVERAGTNDKDAVAAEFAKTDLDRNNLPLLFHSYPGIKFGSIPTWDGSATIHNQNIYASGILTQLINGEWRQVYPDWSKNPLVWPVN